MPSSSFTLLALPLEIRHHIYAYLLPRIPISHPLPGVGLTSVSHALPTSALLNIHPQIADEVLDYFYAITTWKIIFSHAFNFFRVDPHLNGLERCSALGRLRKVEVVLYCDGMLTKSRHSRAGGVEREHFVTEIERKMERAAEVLAQAESLRVVWVSWIDTTTLGHRFWEERVKVLLPLRTLLDRGVEFRVGKVITAGCMPDGRQAVEQEAFSAALRGVLDQMAPQASNVSEPMPKEEAVASFDGASAVSNQQDFTFGSSSELRNLRCLAFDDRQDRIANQPFPAFRNPPAASPGIRTGPVQPA